MRSRASFLISSGRDARIKLSSFVFLILSIKSMINILSFVYQTCFPQKQVNELFAEIVQFPVLFFAVFFYDEKAAAASGIFFKSPFIKTCSTKIEDPQSAVPDQWYF